MIKKKKLFVRPRKMYEKKRISDENAIVEKYGLKSKREIWKAEAKINYFRSRAKDLVKKSPEEQEVLFKKLNNIGLPVQTIADVLALKVENILERRLPTVVVKKGMAQTVRQARQMVVHRKVLIENKVIDIPSYIVPLTLEQHIKIKPMAQKKPKEEKAAEMQVQPAGEKA